MAVYMATVHHGQFSNQLQHRLTLCRRSCVCWLPIRAKTANVTHADTVRVVALTMCSWLADGPAMLDGAVEVNDVVVADVTPAVPFRWLRGVPSLDVSCSIVSLIGGSAAMDDDIVNIPGHSYRGRVMLCEILVRLKAHPWGRRRAVPGSGCFSSSAKVLHCQVRTKSKPSRRRDEIRRI